MKICEIIWRDSCMYITQEPKTRDWKYETISSVGYLLEENDKQIVIAGDSLEIENEVRRVIVIPKENIVK